MKLLSESTNVQRFGGGVEKKITMKIGPKAFQVLSDHLYSRKIEAIVREYSCNAWDSHLQAGKNTVPFEIHLPNPIEPWFSIKDFGIGLSLSGVETMMTYFESLKEDTNILTGAFGLGSKAGFAYTKAFTIETRWNGEKYIVSCFIDENGEPGTKCMNEEPFPTDECNGIEIKIAVKPEDMSSFRESVVKVLQYFPVKPIITGDRDIIYPDSKLIMQGNGWKILDPKEYSPKIIALQGNVAYPLSNTEVDLSGLEQFCMLIEFPIGEICPSPNRETLSYNKPTVANINTRLDSIRKEIVQGIQAKIAKESSLWNASVAAGNILHDMKVNGGTRTNLFGRLSWKKQELPENMSIEEDLKEAYHIDRYKKSYNSKKFRIEKSTYNNPTKYKISDDIRICYNDSGVGRISARLNRKYENKDIDTILVFSPNEDDATKSASRDHLSKSLFGVDVQNMSELTIPRIVKLKDKQEKGKALLTCLFRDSKPVNRDEVVDLATGGFYIRLGKWTNKVGRFYSHNECSIFLNRLQNLGFIDKTLVVYGLKDAIKEKVKKKYPGKWIDIMEYASKKVSDKFHSGAYDSILDAGNHWNDLEFDVELVIQNLCKSEHVSGLSEDIRAFCEHLIDIEKVVESDHFKHIHSVKNDCFLQYTAPENKDHRNIVKKVFDKYPLLRVLFNSLLNYDRTGCANKKIVADIVKYTKDLDELEALRALQSPIATQNAA